MRAGLLFGMVGCQAWTDGSKPGDEPPLDSAGSEDWCQIQALFAQKCTVCHEPVTLQGGLDLETAPYGALVGVTSATYGAVLVTPGNPAGSLLYRKVSGTQSASEGATMPLTGPIETADQDLVERWIRDGADEICGGTVPTNPPGDHHPAGWANPLEHGLATNLQAETDCRTCHGDALDGGSAGVACESCHGPGWETTCTFCHGGVANNTGAPPEDMDGNADPSTISFPPHTEHVAGARHLAYDCVQCHNKPDDALTPGHLFDDPTPGEAEIDFAKGLAAGGNKVGATCTVYCHGDGRGRDGEVSIGDGPLGCTDCHAESGLSGHHETHIAEGLACQECHPDVTGFQISDPDLHVNGTRDVDLPGNMMFDGTSCSGSCHFEVHDDRTW